MGRPARLATTYSPSTQHPSTAPPFDNVGSGFGQLSTCSRREESTHSVTRALAGVSGGIWGRSQIQMKVVILAGGFGQRLAWEILNDDKANAAYKDTLVQGLNTDTPYVASGLIKVREIALNCCLPLSPPSRY